MPYAYAPARGFSVPVPFLRAYTPPRGFSVPIALAPVGDTPVANDDSYNTGKHFPLTVAAPGVLGNDADPGGHGLTPHLLANVSHGTLTFNSDGSFHYVPTSTFLGVDTFTYYVTNGIGIDSGAATVSLNVSLLPVQRYVQISRSAPWGKPPAIMRSLSNVFSRATPVRRSAGLSFGKAAPVRRSVGAPVERAPRVRSSTGLPFGQAPSIHGVTVALPSTRAPQLHASTRLPWTVPPIVQAGRALPFRMPPLIELGASLRWSKPPLVHQAAGIPYLYPPLINRRWFLPWDHAPAIQWHVRGNTVIPPHPEPDAPLFNPGRGFAIPVALACLQQTFRGFAVPVPISAAACYFARPRPRTYIVLNTASVVATLTGHVVNVAAIDLNESRDDLHHSFSLTLADPADLVWLKPTADGPVAIEININGYVRTGIVESWSTEQVFPGRSITVTGRALTALLDTPYAPTRAYIEASDRTSQQLVDQELDLTGFTADYGTVDWNVPAGAWHYDGLTPATAVARVAAAAGALARAHPWDQVIEIRPRYPTSPWDWSTTSPNKTIVDDVVPRLTSRDATSGVPTYELELPLWPTSETDKPGLLRPGQLVEFAAPTSWKAQVASVKISATVQQAGSASALVVWQTVTLEAPPAIPVFDYVLVSGEQVGVSDPVIRDGRAGTTRLAQIVDQLITEHAVAAERGRNAIAAGGDGRAISNLWAQLIGLTPGGRYVTGNVIAINGDGSYTVATSDGATILARPLPGQTWALTDGVTVQDGRIVDSAANLPGITQTV